MSVIRQGAEDGLFTSPVFFGRRFQKKGHLLFWLCAGTNLPLCQAHVASSRPTQAEIWLLEAAGLRLSNLRLHFQHF